MPEKGVHLHKNPRKSHNRAARNHEMAAGKAEPSFCDLTKPNPPKIGFRGEIHQSLGRKRDSGGDFEELSTPKGD